ncbi:MAG: TPM domain-containing protein [Gemmatimonadetes bacterium]|nr:TPM domain-containing protein [Gemmatimonadota bacterium]
MNHQGVKRYPTSGPGFAIALIVAVALHALGMVVHAQDIPEPVGYVNDFANVIPAEREAAMQRVIDEVRQKSGGEIVVVTLPSLEGRSRDEVALRIGREWGIGQRGEPGDPARNTGVLILVVPRTANTGGELKIELGLGASTFITAAEAGRIADIYMVPAFRQDDYGTGIQAGVEQIALQFAERFEFEITGTVIQERRQPQPGPGGGLGFLYPLIVMAILIALFSGRGRGGPGGRGGRRGGMSMLLPFLIGTRMGGRRGGGGFGGGGFGGGGFGGGGFGGFGGGGIGRSW